MPDLYAVARAMHDAGLNPVPVKEDGSKYPDLHTWTPLQTRRVSEADLSRWFKGTARTGVGFLTGAISDNTLMIEWEGRAVEAGLPAEAAALAEASGLGPLWSRLLDTWIVQTPSGGFHFYIRITDGPVPPSTKLAERLATPEELEANPKDKRKVLAETRGEAAFVVTDPSHGTVHPDGGTWETLQGGPDKRAEFSSDEVDALLAIFSAMDQMPEPAAPKPPALKGDELRPGDDYNAKASWDDLLTPAGWAKLHTDSRGVTYWRRPGKDRGKHSATTGRNEGDNLYVFSTSTEFPDLNPISKFHAYAILHHGGDHAAAARELRRQGYGEQSNVIPIRSVRMLPPDIQGSMALHPASQPAPVLDTSMTLTDTGNADLFVARWGGTARYAPHRGAWLRWDGVRWRIDQTGTILSLFRETISSIVPKDDQEVKHRYRSLNLGPLEAARKLAERDPRIVVMPDAIDAHPYLFVTPAGYVNLRTGDMQPPDPTLLLTQSALVGPADMPTPMWDRFLAQTFAGVEEVVPYLQRLLGYSASGSTEFHVLPFLLGGGQNGKSVLLDVIRKLLGDYATVQPSSFLMAHRSNDHETVIARLAGIRFAACSEINEGDKFDEAKVKSLTGGDALTARFLNQNHFTFTPSHKLWLAGNNQPRIPTGGRSIWRRMKLIPFPNEVPDEQKIGDLAEQLVEREGAGILAWIIEGAVAAFADGLGEPGTVQAATQEYAQEEDHLSRFMDECCRVGGGSYVKVSCRDAYESYVQWTHSEHEQAMSQQAFGRALKQRYGVESHSERRGAGGRTARFYHGLSVTAPDEPR